MATEKDQVYMDHNELHEFNSEKLANVQDAELAEALRNYQPGTAAEKKLVRKIDMRYVCLKRGVAQV